MSIYPIPTHILARFDQQERAILGMLEATLAPGGTNRERTTSEADLEARVARYLKEDSGD